MLRTLCSRHQDHKNLLHPEHYTTFSVRAWPQTVTNLNLTDWQAQPFPSQPSSLDWLLVIIINRLSCTAVASATKVICYKKIILCYFYFLTIFVSLLNIVEQVNHTAVWQEIGLTVAKVSENIIIEKIFCWKDLLLKMSHVKFQQKCKSRSYRHLLCIFWWGTRCAYRSKE